MKPENYRKRIAQKSRRELMKLATKYFNAFIRERDKGEVCISCRKATAEQAGHFYAAGRYQSLRFNPLNVHGQCLRCNYYEHANLHEYRKELIRRIGEDAVLNLDLKASIEKQNGHHKLDRFTLMEIIMEYKYKS